MVALGNIANEYFFMSPIFLMIKSPYMVRLASRQASLTKLNKYSL